MALAVICYIHVQVVSLLTSERFYFIIYFSKTGPALEMAQTDPEFKKHGFG